MKENAPVVTAIITCMTDAEKHYVGEAVNSVLAQSTPCLIRLYINESNQWIKQVVQENPNITFRYVPLEPPGIIRNLGVREATTEWVAFLDGDDVWLPKKVECQLNYAIKNKLGAIAANNYFIDENGRLIACALGGKNIPMTSSWLVKKNAFERLKFSAKLTGEDAEWWRHSPDKKARLNSFLIKYRLRGQSLSTDTPSKKRKMKILEASRLPGMRYLLLPATWIANKLYPKK